ncbi:MAG: hypothetical protein IBX40_06640 [Methanosarcinales archaeon]|nr:hypothetical protein [Methanosarcinales archaeon]
MRSYENLRATMNPELRLKTEQIIRQHPNVMRLLFRNIKQHLPLGARRR